MSLPASELRIKNLILIDGIVTEITSINDEGINLESYSSYEGSHGIVCAGYFKKEFSNAKLISGIPLSEAWLIIMGFEKNSETFVHRKERLFEINIDGLTHIWDGCFTGSPCEFVHQIQNLFYCLTGLELEIKPL